MPVMAPYCLRPMIIPQWGSPLLYPNQNSHGMHDGNALHMFFGWYPRPPLQSTHNIVPPKSLLRSSPLGVTTQAFVNGMIGTIDFVNGEHMPTGNILSTTGSSTFMAGNAPPMMMQGRNF